MMSPEIKTIIICSVSGTIILVVTIWLMLNVSLIAAIACFTGYVIVSIVIAFHMIVTAAQHFKHSPLNANQRFEKVKE